MWRIPYGSYRFCLVFFSHHNHGIYFILSWLKLVSCFPFQEYELLKRDYKNLQNDCDGLKEQMAIKDKLLQVRSAFICDWQSNSMNFFLSNVPPLEDKCLFQDAHI